MKIAEQITTCFSTRDVNAEQSHTVLSKIFSVYAFFLSVIGICVSIYHIFHFSVGGIVLWPRAYYCLLVFCFLPLTFLSSRHKKGLSKTPWFDYVAIIVVQISSMYFFLFTESIEYEGWEIVAPKTGSILALLLCIACLEAGRRSGGNIFAALCLVFSFFPLVASSMPGFLAGISFDFWRVINSYVFGTEGLFGIPMRVVGDLLIGYLIFATALQFTGGGKFFLDLAASIFGKTRGGPAKMAIVASGFFGSISGSTIANVCTSGAITIPAMKKVGYASHYAGAVESCASTGGVLMPPIMGAVAFVMANFMGISYASVVVAATIPAILYYTSLILQVDAYAAKRGMKGLSAEECPPVKKVIQEGWPYLFSLGFLIWGLLYMKWDAITPYYATALLLITTMIKKETRLTISKFLDFLQASGKVMGDITSIILLVGFIIASLSMTGVANAFPNEMLSITGGRISLLLLFGGFASFVLGMGMTVTACYVFLAVVLAPALVASGFNEMSAHMFVIYCGVLSYITPPVALSAFAAAGIAEAPAMKVATESVKLGLILFIMPFAFVLSPALVFQAPLLDVIRHFTTFIIGVYMVTGAIEGYLIGVGTLRRWARVLIGAGGFGLMVPAWQLELMGFVVLFLWIGANFIKRKGAVQ